MKKTYLKPNTLVVKVETQQVIALSMMATEADPTLDVYSHEANFFDGDLGEEFDINDANSSLMLP